MRFDEVCLVDELTQLAESLAIGQFSQQNIYSGILGTVEQREILLSGKSLVVK